MIVIRRTHELSDVIGVLRDPVVYNLIRDDASGPPGGYVPRHLRDPKHFYLVAEIDSHVGAVMIFHPLEPGVFDAHMNLLPEYWGKGYSTKLAREACRYMFEHAARTIKATVPAAPFCTPVFNLAYRIGMKIVASTPDGYKRDGKSYDDIIFSLTESELTS